MVKVKKARIFCHCRISELGEMPRCIFPYFLFIGNDCFFKKSVSPSGYIIV
jgi:hypothetical protein